MASCPSAMVGSELACPIFHPIHRCFGRCRRIHQPRRTEHEFIFCCCLPPVTCEEFGGSDQPDYSMIDSLLSTELDCQRPGSWSTHGASNKGSTILGADQQAPTKGTTIATNIQDIGENKARIGRIVRVVKIIYRTKELKEKLDKSPTTAA